MKSDFMRLTTLIWSSGMDLDSPVSSPEVPAYGRAYNYLVQMWWGDCREPGARRQPRGLPRTWVPVVSTPWRTGDTKVSSGEIWLQASCLCFSLFPTYYHKCGTKSVILLGVFLERWIFLCLTIFCYFLSSIWSSRV